EPGEGDGPPGGDLPLRHLALLLGCLAGARARRPLSRAASERPLLRVQRPAAEGPASRSRVTSDARGSPRAATVEKSMNAVSGVGATAVECHGRDQASSGRGRKWVMSGVGALVVALVVALVGISTLS